MSRRPTRERHAPGIQSTCVLRHTGLAVTTPDETLRRAAALGDVRAFEAIIDRHGPAMLRFARGLVPDPGDAEEAVQDAFVSAWRALPTFRGESTLRTWLFTITRRRAVDVARRRRPVPLDEQVLADIGPAGPDPAEAVGLREAITAALAELPARQRAVWVLREVEDLGYAEIAAVLGTTPTTVRGQLARARATLQRRLEPWR